MIERYQVICESLRKYFEQSYNETNEEGRLLSTIPPEMTRAVVEMLVATVISICEGKLYNVKCTSYKVLEIDYA